MLKDHAIVSLATLMLVLGCAAAGDKDGFTDPALPSGMLGLLTALLVPVQALLIAFSMRGFQQAWNVEVERHADGSMTAVPARG